MHVLRQEILALHLHYRRHDREKGGLAQLQQLYELLRAAVTVSDEFGVGSLLALAGVLVHHAHRARETL